MTNPYHTPNDSLNRSFSSVLLFSPSHEPPVNSPCIDLLTRDPPEETNVLSATLSASPADRLSLWKREAGSELPKRARIID